MFDFWTQYKIRRQLRRQAAAGRAQTRGVKAQSPFMRLISGIFSVPGRLSVSVLRSMQTLLHSFSKSRRRWRDLLLGLPAIAVFIGAITATAMGHVRQSGNAGKYWVRGNQYLRDGDPEAAQTLLQKALLTEDTNDRDIVFSLARAYEESKDFRRADALMESLAPVNGEGFPDAHRYLAIRKANLVSKNKEVADVNAWLWHLTKANQGQGTQLDKAWGVYHLYNGDLANSAEAYRRAAPDEPALWLQVAELEARMNDVDAVRRTLAIARRQLEEQYQRNPGDSQNRLLYATSLFYIGDLPNAERLLKEGLAKEDNASFRTLLAAVFVRMFDSETTDRDTIDRGFKFLALALQYEPNYQPALQRLVTVARVAPEKLDEARATMRQMISAGNASAMAHFALGSLEWIAGNQELAKLNMRQAISLDERLVVIANNLAFLLAEEENPDLKTALNLANQAVEQSPGDVNYLDTRAMIYAKMGKYAESAVDFQKILDSGSLADPRPVMTKLAALYERMGDKETAAQFRRSAEELSRASQE